MSDLIERLTDACAGGENCKCSLREAAAELARLTAEVERLRANDGRYLAALQAATKRDCIGYPDCDGDLVAEPHSEKCRATIDGWSDPVGKLMREHIDKAIKEAGNG